MVTCSCTVETVNFVRKNCSVVVRVCTQCGSIESVCVEKTQSVPMCVFYSNCVMHGYCAILYVLHNVQWRGGISPKLCLMGHIT